MTIKVTTGKCLLNSFHFKGHTAGFDPQKLNLGPINTIQYTAMLYAQKYI